MRQDRLDLFAPPSAYPCKHCGRKKLEHLAEFETGLLFCPFHKGLTTFLPDEAHLESPTWLYPPSNESV